MIDFECPKCGEQMEIKTRMAGQQVRCVQCDKLVRVPASEVADEISTAQPADAEASESKQSEGFFGWLLKTRKCEHCDTKLTTGFIYVAADHLYYRDAPTFWSVEWERVRSLDLQNFRMSGTRGFLAAFGGGATGVMLQNVKNTLKVTYLDSQDMEWSVTFRIHGALTVPGEQQTAMEVLGQTNRFKSRFAKPPGSKDNSASGPETVVVKLGQLTELKERGIISAEEFEAKKKEILARM